jgi:peptidyl-prolyl cis-trans isomerase D
MITIEVKKEKKAEKLIAEYNEKINGASDINSLAANLGTTTKLATNIRFSSFQIPQLGNEPELIATSVNLEQGKLSKPIAGTNGVYVIQVDNINEGELTDDYTSERANAERRLSSRVSFSSSKILNKLAKVEDNRILFY